MFLPYGYYFPVATKQNMTLFSTNSLFQYASRNTPWYSNKMTSGMENGKSYTIKLQNQYNIGIRTPKELLHH